MPPPLRGEEIQVPPPVKVTGASPAFLANQGFLAFKPENDHRLIRIIKNHPGLGIQIRDKRRQIFFGRYDSLITRTTGIYITRGRLKLEIWP